MNYLYVRRLPWNYICFLYQNNFINNEVVFSYAKEHGLNNFENSIGAMFDDECYHDAIISKVKEQINVDKTNNSFLNKICILVFSWMLEEKVSLNDFFSIIEQLNEACNYSNELTRFLPYYPGDIINENNLHYIIKQYIQKKKTQEETKLEFDDIDWL